MFKSVEKKIAQLVKSGIPEDFLRDLVDIYSINEDGEPSAASYIIRGLENEVDLFRQVEEENEKL